RAGSAASRYIEIARIQQQRAGLSSRRADQNVSGESEVLLSGYFDKSAIPADGAATGRDRAEIARIAVGPDDHLAAITALDGIGGNGRVRTHVGPFRVGNIGVVPLKVPADERH